MVEMPRSSPQAPGVTFDKPSGALDPLDGTAPPVQVTPKKLSQVLQRMSEALASIGAQSAAKPRKP